MQKSLTFAINLKKKTTTEKKSCGLCCHILNKQTHPFPECNVALIVVMTELFLLSQDVK